jgi:hypothetical protein
MWPAGRFAHYWLDRTKIMGKRVRLPMLPVQTSATVPRASDGGYLRRCTRPGCIAYLEVQISGGLGLIEDLLDLQLPLAGRGVEGDDLADARSEQRGSEGGQD